jgi:ribose/xylose/arabinose/galactoside ABC-type transport system permease subunit
MRRRLLAFLGSQQFGLVVVIVLLSLLLSSFAGSHVDRQTGQTVNNFLNWSTLIQVATETSFFAIMAVGMAAVIIAGGIDLSVGSIYALAGTSAALTLRNRHFEGVSAVLIAAAICIGIGVLCGMLNGFMISGLKVHPFVITLGTMWIYRGISFVTSRAESIVMPDALPGFAKATLGLRSDLYPVPLIAMLCVTALGGLFMSKTVPGRRIFAVGGNALASVYSGIRINRVYIGVYTLSGLCAGLASFIGNSYYGSASCGDASGYELYVIGGVSLLGGKGSAVGAMLGALLIILMRQSIRSFHLDQNYEWIIIGSAIIVAVVLDRMSSGIAAKRIARSEAWWRRIDETKDFAGTAFSRCRFYGRVQRERRCRKAFRWCECRRRRSQEEDLHNRHDCEKLDQSGFSIRQDRR